MSDFSLHHNILKDNESSSADVKKVARRVFLWFKRGNCMTPDRLPPVMSLSGHSALWVMRAQSFEKQSTGLNQSA